MYGALTRRTLVPRGNLLDGEEQETRVAPDLDPASPDLLVLVVIVVAWLGPPADTLVGTALQHLLGGFPVVMKRAVEITQETLAEHRQDTARVCGQDEREDGGVPERQPRTQREARRHYGSPSLSTNPTPRTVWMSREPLPSTFFAQPRRCGRR